MIKYSTKDIIKKAQQLADLENSDFISYNENLTLLNDAYLGLYQTSINAGDLLYIKECVLEDADILDEENNAVAFCLPKDFYQLYSVKYNTLGSVKRPLSRKTKDQTNFSRSYEIRNNNIYIYGQVDSVVIEYFPTPDTLFLKREDIPLDDIPGKPMAIYKDIIISLDEQNNDIIATKVDSGERINSWDFSRSRKIKKIIAADNGFVALQEQSDGDPQKPNITKIITYASYNNKNVSEKHGGEIPLLAENGITSYKGPEDATSMLYVGDEKYITYARKDGDYLNNIKLKGEENIISHFEDNKIFIINKNQELQIYDIKKDELTLDVSSMFTKVIAVGGYDISNGYGYLVSRFGYGYLVTSCFEDTVLDYPNNLYFNILSYMLAISYKTKQSAEVGGLQISLNNAINQYYDTFRRDVNENLRINNIY